MWMGTREIIDARKYYIGHGHAAMTNMQLCMKCSNCTFLMLVPLFFYKIWALSRQRFDRFTFHVNVGIILPFIPTLSIIFALFI